MGRLITTEWANNDKVKTFINSHAVGDDGRKLLSQSQRDVLTPVIISSNNIDSIRSGFVTLYRKTGVIFSPLTFRYSFAVQISKNRSVTIVPLYYIERDLQTLMKEYKVEVYPHLLKPTGADWEEEVYDKLEYFTGSCEEHYNKLIKVRRDDGLLLGWEFKEWKKVRNP